MGNSNTICNICSMNEENGKNVSNKVQVQIFEKFKEPKKNESFINDHPSSFSGSTSTIGDLTILQEPDNYERRMLIAGAKVKRFVKASKIQRAVRRHLSNGRFQQKTEEDEEVIKAISISNTQSFVLNKYLNNNSFYTGYIDVGTQTSNGFGVLNTLNLTFYGAFKYGKLNGYGWISKPMTKDFFEGTIINGKEHGVGIEKCESVIYQGDYQYGRKHGYGKLVFSSDHNYHGELKSSCLAGWGYYSWGKNKWYIGEWKNNVFDGYGELFSDETFFMGFFKANLRHGFGCFLDFKENKAFLGFWKKGLINGVGKFVKQEVNLMSSENAEDQCCVLFKKNTLIKFLKSSEVESELLKDIKDKDKVKSISLLMRLSFLELKELLFTTLNIDLSI